MEIVSHYMLVEQVEVVRHHCSHFILNSKQQDLTKKIYIICEGAESWQSFVKSLLLLSPSEKAESCPALQSSAHTQTAGFVCILLKNGDSQNTWNKVSVLQLIPVTLWKSLRDCF